MTDNYTGKKSQEEKQEVIRMLKSKICELDEHVLTQDRLAKEIGRTQSSVYRYLNELGVGKNGMSLKQYKQELLSKRQRSGFVKTLKAIGFELQDDYEVICYKAKKGYAEAVAEQIKQVYSSKTLGVICSSEVGLVVVRSKHESEEIFNELKDFLNEDLQNE